MSEASKPLNDPLDDPRLKLRSTYSYWVRDRVRWSDTDMAGHANNLAFAAFCESGRALLLRQFMEKGAKQRALLVLAEARLRFLGEINWPAEIDTGTGIIAISKRSCRMGQGLFDGERCVGVAEAVLVMIDEGTRKSCDIPDEVRNWLTSYSLSPFSGAEGRSSC